MGILDKIFGRKKKTSEAYRPLAKNLDTQTDDQKEGTRSRMEAEMQTSKDDRSDRATDAKE